MAYNFFHDSILYRILQKHIKSVILYATTNFKTKELISNLSDGHTLVEIGTNENDDSLIESAILKDDCIILLPTHINGDFPPSAQAFATIIEDYSNDFRVDRIEDVCTVIIGIGDSSYGLSNFCKPAIHLNSWLKKLGHKTKLVKLDENFLSDASIRGKLAHLVNTSMNDLKSHQKDQAVLDDDCGSCKDESEEDQEIEDVSTPEMIRDKHKGQLEREGYRLIGSHSAVKLCRWTKHQIRGRGGCYKHTFYGIESAQCMEATPSLACANKCVFCWRHHKNPTGTSWKWATDSANFIVKHAIKEHLKLVYELRGAKDIKLDRFGRAKERVRHCALSLVGEPIMYPHINDLIDSLHEEGISSFLVTNSQFPTELANLRPVTQLYLSIDAATKDQLYAVDRPLFGDFWERFLACLDILKKKQHTRTVFRLTLVKEYNMQEQADEIFNYGQLIRRGQPDFVEVKAVTFCGNSKASKSANSKHDTQITMKNVPWHEEVVKFCQAIICQLGDEYQIACSHRHSCSVLIANKNKYFINNEWHTWIDYDKFNELALSGSSFTATDYSIPCPSWALHGSLEDGFDPNDERVDRKGRPVDVKKLEVQRHRGKMAAESATNDV